MYQSEYIKKTTGFHQFKGHAEQLPSDVRIKLLCEWAERYMGFAHEEWAKAVVEESEISPQWADMALDMACYWEDQALMFLDQAEAELDYIK